MDDADLSRREFMIAGLVPLSTMGSNLQLQQTQPSENYEFEGAAYLRGPLSARPTPGGSFFDNKIAYAYVYEDENGSRSYLEDGDSSWTPLNYINQVNVFSADDLPEPTNGTHTLAGQTAYQFYGFVTSQYGLDISNGPAILGRHGGIDGFIHTGGNTAIYGRGGGLFMRDIYIHAPFGQIFDVAGDQSTEVLVQSTAFYDAAGLGNIANLGVVEGMRVPTFIEDNFGDFNAGLTVTGTPEKVSIIDTPFRGVTASGVTILEFDANCAVNIVDITSGYVKDVESDTEVIRVDSNATVSQIFQYTGNTHDASVTTSNILTGAAGTEQVGYRVKNSFPIADSTAIGNYSLDTDSTATISTQATDKNDAGAYVTVPGATTSNVDIRWSITDNEATYDGKKDTQVELSATLSVGTGGGDTVATAWFRNGAIVDGTPTRTATEGRGNSVGQSTTSIGIYPNCVTGDVYDIRVANLDSTGDIEVGEMNGLLNAGV